MAGGWIHTSLKMARCAAPGFFLYLVLSQEALAVHNTIKVTTAFMHSPFLGPRTSTTTSARASKMLMKAEKDSVFNPAAKMFAAAMTGIGLMGSMAPGVMAADDAAVSQYHCSHDVEMETGIGI